MYIKKNQIIVTFIFVLFSLSLLSQTKTNQKLSAQKEIKLIIDDEIEVLPSEDADKKNHITVTVIRANADDEYSFVFEIDKKNYECKLKKNERNVISFNESFKIISSGNVKYKIVDKKKLLK